MQGQMLTRSILAWRLTEQATALATINLVVALPMLLVSMLGGTITDRVERRQLVVFGQCFLLGNEALILTLLLTEQLQFWHIMCAGLITGCVLPFIMPARTAITADVVGPEELQSAIAYTSSLINLSRICGPALMGLVISGFEIIGAYTLSIMLYSVAVACMLGVDRNRPHHSKKSEQTLMSDMVSGFRYLVKNRPVLICLLFGLLPMLLAMPFKNLLVMLAEQVWALGEPGVGTLMAVSGVGGVLGSIWIIRRGNSPNRLMLMFYSTLAFGICLAVFSRTESFYLALPPLLAATTFASAAQTINNASIQLLVDDEFRGRMSSLMMMSFGLTPIGVFPMALVADQIGSANAIFGACIILVIATVGFYLLSPTLRRLDQSIEMRLAKASK